MSKTTKLSNKYESLVSDLRALMEQARREATEALVDIRSRTYWLMGRRLAEATADLAPGSLSSFLERVGREVELKRTVLLRALKFYQAFPDGVRRGSSPRRSPAAAPWSSRPESTGTGPQQRPCKSWRCRERETRSFENCLQYQAITREVPLSGTLIP